MIGSILTGLVGIVFCALGYLIWKKEKISLLHDYHYDKVRPEDRKAFCALSGVGVISIGTGLLITAVLLAMTDSIWSFMAFAGGFAAGLALLMTAGKKYNR